MAGPLASAGFLALWHPELLAAAVLLGVAYLRLVTAPPARLAGARPVPPGRRVEFLLGLAALYVAQGSPVALLASRYLFSAHMLQAVLLVLVAPPLLLEGVPVWLLRPLFAVGWVREAVRWITQPAAALLIFIMSFSIFLLPGLNDAALADPWLYTAEHALILVAAFCMWFPVLSPVPEIPALQAGPRMLFTFAVEILMTVPFALITFAGAPLYPTYAAAPRVFGLSALTDQQLGGIIMRLGSAASFGLLLIRTFFAWAAREPALDRALGRPAPRGQV